MASEPAELSQKEQASRLFEQTVEFWLNPEIQRRLQEGSLKPGFRLIAAQVLFRLHKNAPLVRINEEVRAVAEVSSPQPLTPGQPVWTHQIDGFRYIELTSEDANAGHITIIRHKDGWFISFDFQYNAELIRQSLKRAEQFLDAAKHSIGKEHLHAGLDALYSAVELLALAALLPMTDFPSKTHRGIQAPFNKHAQSGNTNSEFADLLNQLTEARRAARYLSRDLNVDVAAARDMLSKAEDMSRAVQAHAPRRRLQETQ